MSKDLIPTQEEMRSIDSMATAATNSKFFNTLNGKDGIFSIMLYAREIGIPPMQALMGGLHNVQGKITMSAQLMNSMIRKAGHTIELIETTDLKCTLKGTRKDTKESATISFSLEDAKKAAVYKSGGSWDKYPSDMCFARALSRLARRLFPDVIGTAYIEGEIEEETKNKEEEKEDENLENDIEIQKAPEKVYTPPSDAMILVLRDKFKPIENMDYDLLDFVKFISEKSSKSAEDTIKQAIKHTDKFSKSYLKWVEEKIGMEPKAVEVVAEEMDMLAAKA